MEQIGILYGFSGTLGYMSATCLILDRYYVSSADSDFLPLKHIQFVVLDAENCIQTKSLFYVLDQVTVYQLLYIFSEFCICEVLYNVQS